MRGRVFSFCTRRSTRGFTLLEILVAFVILGLSAGAVLSLFSSTPTKIVRANNQRRATLAAESVLDVMRSAPYLLPGQTRGAAGPDIYYLTTVSPFGAPPRPKPEKKKESDNTDTDKEPPSYQLYQITVQVSAGPRWNPGKASVTTLRLAKEPPS